ncbi:MAG: CARDB domain-containing protein [bacterium]|nr:CARDB domain-containing protein [bacterium]
MSFKKLVFVIAFLGILAGGFFANAQPAQAATVEELMALIAQLKAQILQLQQQLTTTQGQPAAWCHTFNSNLRFGDNGSEVVALQTALAKDGASQWEFKGYDGIFDEMTASVVVGFQQKYASEILTPFGLKFGTGFVGKGTRAKLNALYGCSASAVQPVTSPVTVIPPTIVTQTSPVLTLGTIITQGSAIQVPLTWTNVQGAMKYNVYNKHSQNEAYGAAIAGVGGLSYTATALATQDNYFQIQACSSITCYPSNEVFVQQALGVTQPSITVLSPNGGEQWAVGNTYDVTWNNYSLPSTCNVSVTLFNPSNNGSAYGGNNTPIPASLGKYSFYVSSVIPIGDNYKIQVIGDKNCSGTMDQSDNYFSIVSAITPVSYSAPEMVYPANGQVLNYGYPHGYMFKVKPIVGATAYRYQFFQNGSSVHDNLNSLSSNGEFAVWPSESSYSKFQEGNVSVWIRALVNGQWTETRTITIILGRSDLYPTPITTPNTTGVIKTGDQVFFDSGVGNKGPVTTGIFNIKWFVDDVQTGYGSHSGVSGSSTTMEGNSQFTWTAIEGVHTIKFVVDADNHVNESDETKNTASTTVTVSPVVASPSITVLSPNGGEKLVAGQIYDIAWKFSGSTDKIVQIELGLPDSDGPILTNVAVSLQRHSWIVPLGIASRDDYRIIIREPAPTYTLLDNSDNYFSIVSP